MAAELDRILRLEVPIIVRLGEKTVNIHDVVSMMPGTIIELPKSADSELELLVNNKVIGTGAAVKVGENFGLRINFIGDVQQRIVALGHAAEEAAEADGAEAHSDESAEAPLPTQA